MVLVQDPQEKRTLTIQKLAEIRTHEVMGKHFVLLYNFYRGMYLNDQCLFIPIFFLNALKGTSSTNLCLLVKLMV